MTGRIVASLLALSLVAAPAAAQSARILIYNADGPGVGFNDPTPAEPIGGNPGTTVGQQALNVFQHAANRWAANLQSTQLIPVWATFTPLSCTATSGVLGAAGPNCRRTELGSGVLEIGARSGRHRYSRQSGGFGDVGVDARGPGQSRT